MKLEMVYSAPNMLRIHKQSWMTRSPENHDYYRRLVHKGIQQVDKTCTEIMDGTPLEISMLHNAHNEPNLGPYFRENGTYGFRYLYCDSGGLQIVTANKTIDDEMKKIIYKNQSPSDFAFCFDEIPCRDVVKGARSNTDTKYYFPKLAHECAVKTAENINEQIKEFIRLGVETKVFYIVQGNTIKDMVDWVKVGLPYIENPDMIAGFAMADTCMGNGQLESVDMLIAYAEIMELTNHKYKRMHLLGVGSAIRLGPAIMTLKSSVLPDDITLSFDSSSLSLTWLYGRIRADGEMKLLRSEHQIRENLFPVLDYFWNIFQDEFPDINKDDVKAILLRDYRSVSLITNIESDEPIYVLLRAFVTLACVWQTIDMAESLVKVMADGKVLKPLMNAKSVEELHQARSTMRSSVRSRRIKRQGITLSNLFSKDS